MTEKQTYDAQAENIIDIVLEYDIQPAENESMGEVALAIMNSVVDYYEKRGAVFSPEQREYIAVQILLGL